MRISHIIHLLSGHFTATEVSTPKQVPTNKLQMSPTSRNDPSTAPGSGGTTVCPPVDEEQAGKVNYLSRQPPSPSALRHRSPCTADTHTNKGNSGRRSVDTKYSCSLDISFHPQDVSTSEHGNSLVINFFIYLKQAERFSTSATVTRRVSPTAWRG